MVYDPAGNLVVRTNFNGMAITNAYDTANRLISITAAGGYNVSWSYSPTGLRSSMTDPSGGTLYTYDWLNRLTSKT